MAGPDQVEEEKNTSGFLETAQVLSQAVEPKVADEAEVDAEIANADDDRVEADPQSRHSPDDRT